MKAQLLIQTNQRFHADAVAHLTIWTLPMPVRGSQHHYKYRLAYVVNDVCVLRYDNEAGKGDHRHIGDVETSYTFIDTDTLIDDFMADIARWNNEHSLV
jgi:hypothetical protein